MSEKKKAYTTLNGWFFFLSGDAVFSVTWELNLRLQVISCVYTFTVRRAQDQQPRGNLNLHVFHIGFVS